MWAMSLPLARTPREAHLYVELHPCACGASFVLGASTLKQAEGGLLVRQYESTCPGCGTARTFLFGLPDFPQFEPDVFGGDEASQIVDAGEWLWLAHRWASSVPVVTSRFRRPDPEHEKMLKMAVAAMDEVLKFFPPGAGQYDELPDEAFWTKRGRAYRARQPSGGWKRGRLEAYRSGIASTPTRKEMRAYRKANKKLRKEDPARA
jgi:hypothetical protein